MTTKNPVVTEKVLLAIIAAIVTISMPLVTYFTIRNSQRVDETIAKIDTLHESVNGKIQLLLERNKEAANLEGRQELKTEQDSIKNKRTRN